VPGRQASDHPCIMAPREVFEVVEEELKEMFVVVLQKNVPAKSILGNEMYDLWARNRGPMLQVAS
jgi:hypothetical protein